VEFALVLPIFMFGIFALVDGGRLVFLNSTLSQAAREGARVGSVEASWVGSSDPACGSTGGPTCPATVDALRADIASAVNRMTGPFGTITSSNIFVSCDASTPPTGAWTTQTCAARSYGNYVSVRVTYTFQPITPLAGTVFGTATLSGSATMMVN
jgi:Flp pilus assembly protein TadG